MPSSHMTKVVRCFHHAKQVNHLYFVHTDGDVDSAGHAWTSIENIQRIVERLIALPVQKHKVAFTSSQVRGLFERYADRIVIYVRADQSIYWQRYTVFKELCHALMDSAEEYNADGLAIIQALMSYKGFEHDWEGLPDEARSEKLAEYMAIELAYPFEHRDRDILELEAKTVTPEALEERRGIPRAWIARSLERRFHESCRRVWKLLADLSAEQPDL